MSRKWRVFPSKAVLGNSLTVLVAGIYLLSVGLYTRVADWFGGHGNLQAKAFILLVALVAVFVVALSERVRLHTRRFISRYFQRPLHDYRSVWRTLTEGTTTRVSQSDLCQAAITLISQIFQTLSVTIWLVDDKKENLLFAASTSLSSAAGADLQPQKEEAAAILRGLHNHPDPVEVENFRNRLGVGPAALHPATVPADRRRTGLRAAHCRGGIAGLDHFGGQGGRSFLFLAGF